MQFQQRTLARAASCAGIGVHSGRTVHLRVLPAPVNHGIQFVRTDLPARPTVPAVFANVVDTSNATVLGVEGCIVSTVEHLMAALAALEIDNARVEIDNFELPIMDGSAAPFVTLLEAAGIRKQGGPKCVFVVKKPITLAEGDKAVSIHPSPVPKITASIDFSHPLIGHQSYTATVTADRFRDEIAPARTFGFLHEVEMMKQFGLGRGGSLDNAVVVGPDGALNPDGLRFPDEFVRHKVLDCIGDISLLGLPILGHLVSRRSGHAFNHAFLKAFVENTAAWETQTLHDLRDRQNRSAEALAV
ncbi:MAG: UDP-3-O-acyl-N-acetylglucosamine deacetylase [Desulfococcaceae bacterium]